MMQRDPEELRTTRDHIGADVPERASIATETSTIEPATSSWRGRSLAFSGRFATLDPTADHPPLEARIWFRSFPWTELRAAWEAFGRLSQRCQGGPYDVPDASR
jgi:hypothetical protein